MSRKHGRKQREITETLVKGSGLVATFAEKVDAPITNVSELMAWVIFGNPKEKLHQGANDTF